MFTKSLLMTVLFSSTLLAQVTVAQVHTEQVIMPWEDQFRLTRWLNNVCGDAWCEGVYDLDFTGLEFKESSKSFLIRVTTVKDETDPSTAEQHPFVCEILDASVVTKTVEHLKYRNHFAAQEKLYGLISECIHDELYAH